MNYDAKIRKKSDMTKRFEHFLHFSAKKKESQLAPAFKKEKYNENCKTLSRYRGIFSDNLNNLILFVAGEGIAPTTSSL